MASRVIDATDSFGELELPDRNPTEMAQYAAHQVIPAALKLMPKKFRGPRAELMLIAIGMQESNLSARVQVANSGRTVGPARGLWQFELIGVTGVLRWNKGELIPVVRDSMTGLLARKVDREGMLTPERLYDTLAYVDLIACIVARCLLYTHPDMLPKPGDEERAWDQYIATWRPGKPSRERWTTAYSAAMRLWTSVPT